MPLQCQLQWVVCLLKYFLCSLLCIRWLHLDIAYNFGCVNSLNFKLEFEILCHVHFILRQCKVLTLKRPYVTLTQYTYLVHLVHKGKLERMNWTIFTNFDKLIIQFLFIVAPYILIFTQFIHQQMHNY